MIAKRNLETWVNLGQLGLGQLGLGQLGLKTWVNLGLIFFRIFENRKLKKSENEIPNLGQLGLGQLGFKFFRNLGQLGLGQLGLRKT